MYSWHITRSKLLTLSTQGHRRFDVVALDQALRPRVLHFTQGLGQGTSPSRALLHSGINEYLVGQRRNGCSYLCSKKEVEMVHEKTGPVTRGNVYESHTVL